jgi:hypothetical protein
MSDTHTTCERSVVLGPLADETRRSLGPLAWAALEALVSDARDVDGVHVANTTVRDLAGRLGVAKNTAHRALLALRESGFVEPLQSRSTSGQFAVGAYRVAVAPSVLRLAAELAAPRPLRARSVQSRAVRPVPSPSRQLSLLPSV